MADVEIKYKGASIAALDASGTKTLKTAGKYCEGDVIVEYTDPEKPTQVKSVTPSETAQEVTPDSGKVLSKVSVGAISKTYVGSSVVRKAAQTYTPGTANQTIDAGQYLSGAQTVKGDANLLPENIKEGVTIFGKTGTHKGGITPSGTKSITANGTYDVTQFASAEVEVPEPTPKNQHAVSWNFASREERKMYSEGTYAFNSASTANHMLYLPTDDTCWINGGQHPSTTQVVVWDATNNGTRSAAVSDVTETGFKVTTGAFTELFILVPYYLEAGQTLTLTCTRGGTNRGGYVWCDRHGKVVSHELIADSGAGAKTWTYTAPTDGWLYLEFGKYNANDALVISNASVSIA